MGAASACLSAGVLLRLWDGLASLQGVGGTGAGGDSWVRFGGVSQGEQGPGIISGVSSSLPSLLSLPSWGLGRQYCSQARL